MKKTKQPLTVHSDKTWEEVKEMKFMPIYRMGELQDSTYFRALRSMTSYFEWSNGRPAENIGEVTKWVEREDILFHANGDMIGGDE